MESDVKVDTEEGSWEDLDWIHMVQDLDNWWALVNTGMNFRVPYIEGNFVSSWETRLLQKDAVITLAYTNIGVSGGHAVAQLVAAGMSRARFPIVTL
jgi:hypothetical protein